MLPSGTQFPLFLSLFLSLLSLLSLECPGEACGAPGGTLPRAAGAGGNWPPRWGSNFSRSRSGFWALRRSAGFGFLAAARSAVGPRFGAGATLPIWAFFPSCWAAIWLSGGFGLPLFGDALLLQRFGVHGRRPLRRRRQLGHWRRVDRGRDIGCRRILRAGLLARLQHRMEGLERRVLRRHWRDWRDIGRLSRDPIRTAIFARFLVDRRGRGIRIGLRRDHLQVVCSNGFGRRRFRGNALGLPLHFLTQLLLLPGIFHPAPTFRNLVPRECLLRVRLQGPGIAGRRNLRRGDDQLIANGLGTERRAAPPSFAMRPVRGGDVHILHQFERRHRMRHASRDGRKARAAIEDDRRRRRSCYCR